MHYKGLGFDRVLEIPPPPQPFYGHSSGTTGRHSIHSPYSPVLTSTIPPYFLRAGYSSCRPANSVKALKLLEILCLKFVLEMLEI